jgi:hypothetical protein
VPINGSTNLVKDASSSETQTKVDISDRTRIRINKQSFLLMDPLPEELILWVSFLRLLLHYIKKALLKKQAWL